MDTPDNWKCPGCGAIVSLPAGRQAVEDHLDAPSLDRLAQAVCGCWVGRLKYKELTSLLTALLATEDHHALPASRFSSPSVRG
jgi:hypothetical protein